MAGIPVGVNVAPIIPGLNDGDIPSILEAAADAGATRAGRVMVRLPGEVNTIFETRIRDAFPLRADKIFHRIEDARDGQRNDPCFGRRLQGRGPYWSAIESLFQTTCARVGLEVGSVGLVADGQRVDTFERPGVGRQLSLF